MLTLKKNDTYPPLRATLTDAAGAAVDLTDAAVTIRVLDSAGAVKIAAGACTITNAALGEVQYSWAAGDTNAPGIFRAEFHVVLPGTIPATFPNDGFLFVEILNSATVP